LYDRRQNTNAVRGGVPIDSIRGTGISRAWAIVQRGGGIALGLLLALSPLSCGPPAAEVVLRPYLPRSAHQAYGYALAQTDLTRSALGQAWMDMSERALLEPRSVETPFEERGVFDPAAPAAMGYRFTAESGRRIEVDLRIADGQPTRVFVDLFRLGPGLPRHVASAPPAPATGGVQRSRRIELELLQAAEYVLRVQPELLRGGPFSLSIRTVPALAFPVEGYGTSAIQSGFGVDRDGGKRAHRGVDIFAPRGTRAIAAVDARVSRVETTGRGGNVVWLQPLFGDLRLYYAHLDSQTVAPGQYVFAGEAIGTVGNTGNARSTPPHLHFGVYVRRRGGAWDPYPFLRN